MSGFSSIVHLLGRHPQLARHATFQEWLNRYGGELWHETHRSVEGFRTVVIQSLDGLRVFAAQTSSDDHGLDYTGSSIVSVSDFDLIELGADQFAAIVTVALERNLRPEQIQALRPVIQFDVDPPQFLWEIEFRATDAVESFQVDSNNRVVDFHKRILEFPDDELLRASKHTARFANDWLASNELHHPKLFLTEALHWTAGATTTTEKASRIMQNVADSYAFDSTICRIKEFTFADILVRDRLGRRGVCDEFAVVMTTYLRALEIPAAVKLLNFQTVDTVGHACIEFFDGHRWVHVDPLYGVFDNPAFYRTEILARNVLVMDADYPRDDRSDAPAFGLPDFENDLQLNPYTDFLLNPCYPGNQRPGYSY